MTVTPIQQINIEERRQKVVELKKIGMSDRDIMTHLNSLGIKISHVQVNRDWHKVLDDWAATRTDEINGMKELQNYRYEAMIAAHWTKATGRHLAEPGEIEAKITDPDPRSAEIVLRTIKGIRELYGLDNTVGTAENPLILNLPPETPEDFEFDLTELNHDELERLNEIVGAIIEAQDIATGNA